MKRLNLGPGTDWSFRGWSTLDFYNDHADIQHDLRKGKRLPLPAHSVEKIFSSQVIEHISDEAARSLFRECYRALRYGGIVRFACPNAAAAIANYRTGDADPKNEVVTAAARRAEPHLRLLNVFASFKAPNYRGLRNARDGTYAGGRIASAEEVDRRLDDSSIPEFGQWCVSMIPSDATYVGHVNCYTPDKLLAMLREAGFRSARLSAYRCSEDQELRGEEFDSRPGITLFVEARANGPRKRLLQLKNMLRRRLKQARLRLRN